MLKDVRDIIAEQLGKDLKEARRCCAWLHSTLLMHGLAVYARHTLRSYSPCARPVRPKQRPGRHCQRLSFSSAAQVTPEAKFVDMGADSLDTVRCDLLYNSAGVQLLAGTMFMHGCMHLNQPAALITTGRDHDGTGGEV